MRWRWRTVGGAHLGDIGAQSGGGVESEWSSECGSRSSLDALVCQRFQGGNLLKFVQAAVNLLKMKRAAFSENLSSR